MHVGEGSRHGSALGSCICPSHQEEACPRRAPGFCLAVPSNPAQSPSQYSTGFQWESNTRVRRPYWVWVPQPRSDSHFHSCSSRGCSGPKTNRALGPHILLKTLPRCCFWEIWARSSVLGWGRSRRTNHLAAVSPDLLTLQPDLWTWCHGDGRWGNRNSSLTTR